MAKKQPQKRTSNLSPLSLLRPCLEGLLQNPGWAAGVRASIYADLAAVVKRTTAVAYLQLFD